MGRDKALRKRYQVRGGFVIAAALTAGACLLTAVVSSETWALIFAFLAGSLSTTAVLAFLLGMDP